MITEILQPILERIRDTVYPLGAPFILGLVFAVLAARARASALSDFKVYDKIWQPVSASLKESPSASDTLISGIRAFFRGSFRFVLMVFFGFLALDFIFARGDLTYGLLVLLGL